MKNLIACLLGITLILLPTVSSVARAANKDKDEDRLKDCGTVLKEILDIPDNIPQDLLDKADCVVVYPSVLKAAFVVGGSYGRGAMTCRKGENFMGAWSAPTMMALEGGSFGFQIGGQATDFVLLVMNESGARGDPCRKGEAGRGCFCCGRTSRPRRLGRDRRDLALRNFELFPFPWPVCRHLSGRLNHPTRQQSKRANLWKEARGQTDRALGSGHSACRSRATSFHIRRQNPASQTINARRRSFPSHPSQ